MKIRRQAYLLICLIIFFLFFCKYQVFAIDIFNKSSAANEFGFDLMETFDDLNDWSSVSYDGGHIDHIQDELFPKRIDGNSSPFNTMDYWRTSAPEYHHISNHSVHGIPVWRNSGKSLSISPVSQTSSSTNVSGMARFGVTLSNTGTDTEDNAKFGYDDIFVFFMVYKPSNFYPNCISNGYGRDGGYCGGIIDDCDGAGPCGYYLGEATYDNYASIEKFITFGVSSVTPYTTYMTTHWGMDGSYPVDAYTETNLILYHGVHNDYPELTWASVHHLTEGRTEYPCSDDYDQFEFTVNSPYSGGHPPLDEWYGVEVELRANSEVDGRAYSHMWWYEKDGTVHDLGERDVGVWYTACDLAENLKINRVFIGGNNSNTWRAGPGMTDSYYVDDFIVNDSRIGLTYFTVLNNQNVIRADVDQSGNISSTDAMLTIRNSLGLDMLNTNWQSSTTTGDVNCDGVSNSTDAMLILRYSLGLDMSGTGWCE